MVGLLRSFTVNTFDPNDPPGQTLCAMINQRGAATEILIHDLLEDVAEIRAGLRQELTIGLGQEAEELENRGPAVRVRLVLGHRRRGTRGAIREQCRRAADRCG